MGRLLLGWIINAVAILAAFKLVPGIHESAQSVPALLGIALVFGLLNAVVRPLVKLFTCPFLLLTLGLGILLVNALMFWLTGMVGSAFGVGFKVDGFGPAFMGALVVSIVSFVLNMFLPDKKDDEDR